MWRKKRPSYNLAMLDARLAHACLAFSILVGACSPSHQVTPGGEAGSAGQAGSGGTGGAGADAGGAAGTGTAGTSGSAGASGGGTGGSGGVPNCGPLGGSGGGGGSAGTASGAAPAPMPVGTDLGALTVESVATWKNAAKGAYTIIHDDICDYNIDSLFTVAEPELTKRGLHAAFGAIVERCKIRNLWSQLEMVRSHGHEIINHTWDHKDIVTDPKSIADPVGTLDQQLNVASATLDENLVNQHTSFFIFPYDSFNDAAVARLRSLNYLGARAGTRGLNGSAFADGMRVSFDVYERPTSTEKYSIYWDQPDIMKYYVDLAVSLDGWAVREFHGVADQTFEPVALADYQAHLDDVKAKQDAAELWVDTPSNVLRYHFSRMYCGVPAASGYSVVPAQPSCECGYYSAPLSVIVKTTTDAPSAIAVQDGMMMPTRKLEANRFVVDMNPLGGPVAVGGGT